MSFENKCLIAVMIIIACICGYLDYWIFTHNHPEAGAFGYFLEKL